MSWFGSLLERRKGATDVAPISEYTGPVKRVRPARNVKATIKLPEGVAYKDFVNGTVTSSLREKVEAAAGWPIGSMVCAPNFDNAGYIDVTLSDPRILKSPIPWEGPSWTGGASIADSISIGMYQDGTECEVEIPETHVQVMGQIGSGKSLGAAWNALSEMVTRPDCIVWAIDIKKGLQTLGPLVPSLHRVATTPGDALDLLRDADNLIKPRTDFLSSDGLGKWFRNCKINYLVVWIEEAPYVLDQLGTKGTKAFVNTVKASRSAGITVAWSLQKASFTELPTTVRDQATKWCFGVQDAKASKFGLSKVQIDAGCTPEMWGQRMPGMSYIDAPNIHTGKVGMPLRAWWFGKDDKAIKAHAASFPWQDREYDDLMKEYFAAKERGETIIDLYESKKKGKAATPPVADTPVEASDSEPPTTPAKADIKTALNQKQRGAIGRRMVEDYIKVNAGKKVSTREFLDIVETLGLTRPWINLQLNALVKEGKVKKTKRGHAVTWEILPIATD